MTKAMPDDTGAATTPVATERDHVVATSLERHISCDVDDETAHASGLLRAGCCRKGLILSYFFRRLRAGTDGQEWPK